MISTQQIVQFHCLQIIRIYKQTIIRSHGFHGRSPIFFLQCTLHFRVSKSQISYFHFMGLKHVFLCKKIKSLMYFDLLIKIISLIIQGCSMVYYSIWSRNHTSHKNFYFNEFVANVMRDVIGIVIFDLLEASRDQKHPSEAKNDMKELIYWKKLLMKVAQQPQKPLTGSIRFELRPQVRKIHEQPPRSLYVHSY